MASYFQILFIFLNTFAIYGGDAHNEAFNRNKRQDKEQCITHIHQALFHRLHTAIDDLRRMADLLQACDNNFQSSVDYSPPSRDFVTPSLYASPSRDDDTMTNTPIPSVSRSLQLSDNVTPKLPPPTTFTSYAVETSTHHSKSSEKSIDGMTQTNYVDPTPMTSVDMLPSSSSTPSNKPRVCPANEGIDCASRTPDMCYKPDVDENCPYLCGYCHDNDKPSCKNDPQCYVSSHGCEYQGVRPTEDYCLSLGNGGYDFPFCHDPSANPCARCRQFRVEVFASKYCPVLCGICDAPCGGKTCANGQLDMNTCNCTCDLLYKGELCEISYCPTQEYKQCETEWQFDYCSNFPNYVPARCPYLCGICKDSARTACENDPNCYNTGGCEYNDEGNRPSKEQCTQFGINGDDMAICNRTADPITDSNAYTCYNCKWTNDAIQKCPVMCSACDPPAQ